MREIKFRAWAFDDDFMIDDAYSGDDFVFSADGGKVELLEAKFDQIDQAVSGYGKCNHSIMQYTGLKDKNGVEACECDILKCAAGLYWVVKFINGCFCACDPNEDENFVFLDDYDFEVIGNIYENPELLEAP